jgi:hypothetical protein
MNIEPIPKDFWIDNVSRSHGKHNISPEAWVRICKIRNSPIILIEDYVIGGESHKPHMVIPKGYKGYLIDHPEVFNLSEDELEAIKNHVRFPPLEESIPAWFFGIDHIVFLFDYHYEIIDPYFDMGLANYGYDNALID